MRKPLCLLLVSVCCAIAGPARADASAASVEQLLQITKVQSQLDRMYAQTLPAMQNAMRQSFGDQLGSDEARRVFDAIMPRINQMMQEEMSWDALKPQFVAIYEETFSQAEIDGLIAFYQTPVGMAVVDKMPQVVQRSMLVAQQRMIPLMRKVQQISQEEMERAKAGTASKP